MWVDAYRDDFKTRGESKLTVTFDSPNHICRADQERLLLGAMAGGEAGVTELVSASLCEWALATGNSYSAGLRAGPSVRGPRLEVWFDGGSRGNPGTAGAGALVHWCDDDEKKLASSHWSFVGDSNSNNEAEYQGLLCGLDGALNLLNGGAD